MASAARKAAEAFIAVGHVWDGPTCIRAVEIITSLLAEQPEAGADPVRRFGLSALAAWWDEGNPGDLGGDDLQEFAERAGLWHRVERHADGVECEWCQNDGSGCGELTEAGDRAVREADDLPLRPAPSPARDEVARLTALLHECNAVCLCGCPDGDHEADECGESCGHDDHECICVPKSVLAYVETLRRAPARDEVREAPGVNVARGLELQKDLAIVTAQAIVGVAHRADVKKARRLLDAWYIDNGERLLAALSSPTAAPARDEVREAAAKLDSACRRKEALSWCGRKACDEVWSSACTLLAAIAARGGE